MIAYTAPGRKIIFNQLNLTLLVQKIETHSAVCKGREGKVWRVPVQEFPFQCQLPQEEQPGICNGDDRQLTNISIGVLYPFIWKDNCHTRTIGTTQYLCGVS